MAGEGAEVKDSMIIKELRVEKLGLAKAPVATQGAYTQTYSTGDKTIANPAAASIGDLGATQNTGWGADTEAHFDSITTAIDNLIADVLDLKQAVTSIIDDLQAAGISG
jgi:hypothetical protein